ncbi:hypothetical protein BAUCODRAFT_120690 [Baudoinia panamericana UAMH 10762]|uniref:Uncharacterized protein n=1 Tax=Baudoinia panamericana (strain UAMH 10762) TaxID=717646 RepID=M2NFI0_BAUPA|nr:uncharacterized protein BAUCODRAFT_120690 [Baudoinia panamericana UAMH 10762]EMC97755.1 hypothetical protein BAUCODRAFT_120690 [Baudoinia panamericana UAMH 10762]
MATTNPANLPGAPVDPASAQGAQIPLQSFNVPDFPPSARGLKALTLTSDIQVDNYQSILGPSYSIPSSLPVAIESLTLELFSLGYPSGFLTDLAKRLPNLKSVVLYSQLFAGTTEESQKDAVQFFKHLPFLRALHLLDVFAQPGYFAKAAEWLKYNTSDMPGEARRGLMFLEVNYTFRGHEDEEFMGKIQAHELPKLIGPGLISCSFNVAAPEEEGSAEGIMAYNAEVSDGLVKALTEDEAYPRGLRALNCTLYTLTMAQLRKVLEVQKNIMVLNVTLETAPGADTKKALIKVLEGCKNLEQVELVASPTMEFIMALQEPGSGVLEKSLLSAADLAVLTAKCANLKSFKASVLRAASFGTLEWEKKGGKWVGGAK